MKPANFFADIAIGQFEAALAMLRDCIEQCPEELWEQPIVALSFRQVAYHTLFFVDYYLSASEAAFEARPLHAIAGDERLPHVSPGLSKADTLAYLTICHEKLQETLSAETEATLQAPAGFSRRRFSRGELHIYNLRHVQHHTGQLSARLRQMIPSYQSGDVLPWIGSGWRH
jgi:uncharacterized damage-inducible protein DinB